MHFNESYLNDLFICNKRTARLYTKTSILQFITMNGLINSIEILVWLFCNHSKYYI